MENVHVLPFDSFGGSVSIYMKKCFFLFLFELPMVQELKGNRIQRKSEVKTPGG